MIENIEVGSSISSFCHSHPNKGYKISLWGKAFRVNRTTIQKIDLQELSRDRGVLDTNLNNKTEIRCKIVVLGLLGLDWGGDCLEVTGFELPEINNVFC